MIPEFGITLGAILGGSPVLATAAMGIASCERACRKLHIEKH